jgi:hypothetical protein
MGVRLKWVLIGTSPINGGTLTILICLALNFFRMLLFFGVGNGLQVSGSYSYGHWKKLLLKLCHC